MLRGLPVAPHLTRAGGGRWRAGGRGRARAHRLSTTMAHPPPPPPLLKNVISGPALKHNAGVAQFT